MVNEKSKVAVLGPLGTYTHEAAFQTFGHDVCYDEQLSIAAVFRSLSPKVPLGVVPQENTIFGNVVETYDILRIQDAGFIRGEIVLKIEHCLLVRKGVMLHQIKRIMSHEQALGQCSNFIAENFPHASTVKTPSTAAAAQALLEGPTDSAAICSRVCATIFQGLEILSSGIQNEKANYTRFFVITPSQQISPPPVLQNPALTKALFRISAPLMPSPCSDQDIMKYLKALELPTTRLDRRPLLGSSPFHDVYFVEVHGCSNNLAQLESIEWWAQEVDGALNRVRSIGGNISLVGIW